MAVSLRRLFVSAERCKLPLMSVKIPATTAETTALVAATLTQSINALQSNKHVIEITGIIKHLPT
nr:MAG TPA: hypothetical protein [Caudoviricetes sp.]